MGRSRTLQAAVVFVWAVALAFSSLASAEPKGRLVMGVASLGGERLDYSRFSGTTNQELTRAINRNLIQFGYEGEYVPGTAESWKMSPDGKVWDLVLRKGVKWHNGETLTAQDVLFGVERMKRPEIRAGVFVSELFDNLVRVEAVNDYQVRYFFKVPFPVFPYFVNSAPPMPKKYIEKVGDAGFDDKPIGTGPFKFVRRIKGSEYEFEAFENFYTGQIPQFKTLVINIMPEGATRLAALKTGEIDIAKDVQGKMLEEVRSTPGLKVTSTPSGAVTYLSFAHRYEKDSPWADLRVRKAVAYAVDKDAIVKAIYRGEATPAIFPDCSVCFGMPKDMKPWPYDPEKAKALLAEAGYPNGLPGEWDLQCQISGSAPYQPEVVQAVGGFLAKVGIKTKYQLIEGGAYAAAFKAKKLKGLPTKSGGDTRFDVGLKTDVWAARAEEWSMLKDEDTNKLWDDQLVTVDPEKRRKLLEEAVRIIINDVRLVPFVEMNAILGLGPKVKEYKLKKGQVIATDALETLKMSDQP
jgi:peptide/nickel transport system substrate-binding protein